MNNIKQYNYIKFPFTVENSENYFIDLNQNKGQEIRGKLMHVIFTSKGSKLRDPEFGTDLIRYIFEPNDSTTWNTIKEDVSSAVSKFVADASINDLSIVTNNEDNHEVYVRIDYSIKQGRENKQDSIVVKI